MQLGSVGYLYGAKSVKDIGSIRPITRLKKIYIVPVEILHNKRLSFEKEAENNFKR